MEEAVINSTVLIFLAKIGRLGLLQIYKKIYTTSVVRDEVLNGKDIPLKEKDDLENFFVQHIKIANPSATLSLGLQSGETSAISFCKEKNLSLFLSDDKNARKAAQMLSINITGTIGVILENLQRGNLTKNEAKNILQLLISNSCYISTEVYAKAIGLIEGY